MRLTRIQPKKPMTDMRADMGGGGFNALSLQGPLCPHPRLRPATLRSGLFQRLRQGPGKTNCRNTSENYRMDTSGESSLGCSIPMVSPHPPLRFTTSSRTVQWLRMSLGSSSSSATPISVTLDFCKWKQFLTYWDSED